MRILLDTNAYSALFSGDQTVLQVMGRAECTYASTVVIGELEAGFRGGNRYLKNLELLERVLSRPTVQILPVSRETSECFGRIMQALKASGTPIPTNDVWIAAQCVEMGSVLVTRDQHFNHVAGIRVWSHGAE